MSDTVTILRARGRRLAKLILPDGTIQSYDSARTFDMTTRTVVDLATLGALLETLLPRPDCAVVRGQPVGPVHGVRRLVHPDAKTGDAPTLLDTPRRWLALDMEGIALPATRGEVCGGHAGR